MVSTIKTRRTSFETLVATLVFSPSRHGLVEMETRNIYYAAEKLESILYQKAKLEISKLKTQNLVFVKMCLSIPFPLKNCAPCGRLLRIFDSYFDVTLPTAQYHLYYACLDCFAQSNWLLFPSCLVCKGNASCASLVLACCLPIFLSYSGYAPLFERVGLLVSVCLIEKMVIHTW